MCVGATLDSVRLDNLRWRLSACRQIEPLDLPPSLRGLVTDTVRLSSQARAPPCWWPARETPRVRTQRSQSWSSRETGAGSWQSAVSSSNLRRVPSLRRGVSFDPEPPVEVPTIISRGLQLRVKDRITRHRDRPIRRMKSRRCAVVVVSTLSKRKLRTRRVVPKNSCFAPAVALIQQVRGPVCVLLSTTVSHWAPPWAFDVFQSWM